MQAITQFLSQPWHWSVGGLAISGILWALLYTGKEFGVSSNLRTMCSIAGAGRASEFFRFDWKAQRWNLLFIAGAVVGGFIAVNFLGSPEPVAISASTIDYLATVGVDYPGNSKVGDGFVPSQLFSIEALTDPVKLAFLVAGGFLVGFGTRWAGGCTSGHAISGLSNLQLPSLVAVIGFFMGGLIMTWLILPYLLPFVTNTVV
jgi:hypothetical protein